MAGKNNDDIENLPSSSSIGMNIDPEPNPRPEQPRHERREDNPYSFKKFLNQDCGSRRKEYAMDSTPVPHHNPELSSVLPDFVQDHLVVEQCYSSPSSHHGPIPFDLPMASDDRSDSSHGMILPDFLSDGPIHSQRNDVNNGEYLSTSELAASNGHLMSQPSLTRNEVDVLEREIDYLRRQLNDRNRKVNRLESEIASLHSRETRDTNSLEYALKQAEANLRRNTKRMLSAESSVLELERENKTLRSRVKCLEDCQEASTSTSNDTIRSRNQRLAQDLRRAASSAQAHINSLSSGINNLNMLASTLEGDLLFTDYDDTGAAASGPAL